jgi:hypothetical protein
MEVFDAALRERILVAPGTLFSNSSRFDHYVPNRARSCGWQPDCRSLIGR